MHFPPLLRKRWHDVRVGGGVHVIKMGLIVRLGQIDGPETGA